MLCAKATHEHSAVDTIQLLWPIVVDDLLPGFEVKRLLLLVEMLVADVLFELVGYWTRGTMQRVKVSVRGGAPL